MKLKNRFVPKVFLLVTALSSPAFAQDTSKADVSAGYQWFGGTSAGDWRSFPKGWYVEAAPRITDTLSIVGQVSGNYANFADEAFDLKVHTFMVGLRRSTSGRTSAYGQALVGGVSLKATDEFASGTETDLGFQIGGGVNVKGGGPMGFRVGADYLRVMAKDDGEIFGGDSMNGFRVIVGINIGIGSR